MLRNFLKRKKIVLMTMMLQQPSTQLRSLDSECCTSKGFQMMTQQAVVALLRRPQVSVNFQMCKVYLN